MSDTTDLVSSLGATANSSDASSYGLTSADTSALANSDTSITSTDSSLTAGSASGGTSDTSSSASSDTDMNSGTHYHTGYILPTPLAEITTKADTFFYDPLSSELSTPQDGWAYTLSTTDGSAVPSWIHFDNQSMSLYGVAPASAKGDSYTFKLDETNLARGDKLATQTDADEITISVSNSSPDFFDYLRSAISGLGFLFNQTLSNFWDAPVAIANIPDVPNVYDVTTPTDTSSSQSTVASDASQLTSALASTGADSSASTATTPVEDSSTTPLVAAAQA